MPAYYFHIAIELFQTAHSATSFDPSATADIFSSNLPSHKASSWASYLAPKSSRKNIATTLDVWRRGKQNTTISGTSLPHRGRSSLTEQKPSLIPEQDESLPEAGQDWRLDEIFLESIDMEANNKVIHDDLPSAVATKVSTNDQRVAASGLALKGKYVPSNPRTTEIGWGVVHLYRDAEPSTQLGSSGTATSANDGSVGDGQQAFVDKDCTTLCILAVPSYMTPADLLGWLGEDTADAVSHFRLVRSNRANKYMVLMKFREAAQAKKWQKAWNGQAFNSMEPENCHVVFVKSIQFQLPDEDKDPSSFPDRTHDPFIPQSVAAPRPSKSSLEAQSSATLTAKPVPPPTPALVELPTCPVCLERMDETTGLATIFCQHVFHCACLQKWRNSGCPVCRYTQNEPMTRSKGKDGEELTECAGCGSRENLWICLICGNVGCGRYDEAHAFGHFEQTGHMFAMDIGTQHIWDYAGDEYVHRLIQNKSDGKLLDLPSTARDYVGVREGDWVPVDKLNNVSEEYTYLITSQLESQRQYFEEQVDRAVDKAAKAAAAAEQANDTAMHTLARLESLQALHDRTHGETVPGLEREKERAERRAQKFETMARNMEKEWKENKVINESLMERIAHLEKQLHEATLQNSDLQEQNRDLSFFISGMEKLKDAGSDVQEGSVTVGEAPSSSKKKRKPVGKKAAADG